MRPKALLGIAGVSTPQNTAEIFADTSEPEPSSHQLMLGAVYDSRYALAQVFPSREDILSLLYVQRREFGKSMLANLNLAIQVGGPRCKGLIVQSGAWPSETDLEAFRVGWGRDATMALVLSEEMLEWCDHSPGVISRNVGRYRDLIDYVLVTPKMRHKGYDPVWLEQCISRLYGQHEWVGLAIAQMPSPETLDMLQPLITRCPEVGLVAGEHIRSGDNWVDPARAQRFLERAASMYNVREVAYAK